MKNYPKRVSDKVAKLLDEHIKAEGESSQLYLAMSTWFEMYGFPNLASLYKKYSEEEREHMEKVYSYCLKRNYLPKTPAFASMPNSYGGVEEILEKTYDHEIMVTERWREFTKVCLGEEDHISRVFAEEFLTEQIEEEDKALNLCDMYKTLGECPARDFHFDARMA